LIFSNILFTLKFSEVDIIDWLVNIIVLVLGYIIITLPNKSWYQKINEVAKTVIAFIIGLVTFNFFLKFISFAYLLYAILIGDALADIFFLAVQAIGYTGSILAAMSIYSKLAGKAIQPVGIALYGLCTGLAIWAAIVSIQNNEIFVGIAQIVSVAVGAYGLFKIWQPKTA
jgi:hypothetical protein